MAENEEYSSEKSANEENQNHSGSKIDAVDKSSGFLFALLFTMYFTEFHK